MFLQSVRRKIQYKTACKNREVKKADVRNLEKKNMNLFSQVWSQVIMSVLQLNYDKNFN